MNVFLSWSGDRSRAVAELLNDWLKCVLQAAKPFISTRDIDRGSLWFSRISERLSDTTTGIVCLTAANKTNPWILFEAGALAKGLSQSRVCTFLIDLQPADVENPLAQFNHTFPTKESVFALVDTLNGNLPEGGLAPDVLNRVLETYWPQFEEGFNAALAASSADSTPATPARSEDSILAEILNTTRSLAHRVGALEHSVTFLPSQLTIASANQGPRTVSFSIGDALSKERIGSGTVGTVIEGLNTGTVKLMGIPTSDVSLGAVGQVLRKNLDE